MTTQIDPPIPPARPITSAGAVVPPPPEMTAEQVIAKGTAQGMMGLGATLSAFANPALGEVDLIEAGFALKDHGAAANRGDLNAGVAMLAAQAATLNQIYSELARRAALHMDRDLNATDRYLRLALKAQGQCRATVETLAAIKNPPIVFAKQANIAHGPQQVNNGMGPFSVTPAGKSRIRRSKLLDARHGERLDSGTTGTAIGSDSTLATVGTFDRPDDSSRQGNRREKREPGIPTRNSAGTRPGTD